MASSEPPSGPQAPAHNDLERVTRIELAWPAWKAAVGVPKGPISGGGAVFVGYRR